MLVQTAQEVHIAVGPHLASTTEGTVSYEEAKLESVMCFNLCCCGQSPGLIKSWCAVSMPIMVSSLVFRDRNVGG